MKTLLLLSSLLLSADAQSVQRQILTQLYDATDGDNWVTNTNWNSAENICKWHGIQCPGGYNSEAEMVSGIYLGNNNLNGTVPFTQLLLLEGLEKLYMHDNPCEYPDEIDAAAVGGSFIESQLSEVDLSNTEVHHLDGIFGVDGGPVTVDMYNLRDLYLINSHLGDDGFPEVIFTFGDLVKLYMDDNHLSGTLPSELQNLDRLQHLSFGGNDITGTIPAWLSTFERMRHLDLAENILTGTIPAELGDLTKLFHLDLSNESFRGVGLTGTLPSLTNARSLLHFDVAHNSLSGTIPEDFMASASFDNLGLVALNSNYFTGVVPPIVAQLDAVITDNWFDDASVTLLCDNEDVFNTALDSWGCDAMLCPAGTWNVDGRQRDDTTPCLPCPMAEDSNFGHTTCPSQSPSMLPSAVPTVSQSPTVTPTLSQVPSINIMEYWTIYAPDPVDHPRIIPRTSEDTPSIDVNYRVGNLNNILVSLYQSDCSTGPITTDLLTTSFTSGKGGYTHAHLLTVNVAIHSENMSTSSFWDTEEEILEFCVRTELRELDGDRSITYLDTVIKFNMDMTTGFSISGLEADGLDFDLDTTTSKLTHQVSGCVCDEYTHVCVAPEDNFELVQNMIYSLCLVATDPNVEVKAVNDMTIVQDGEDKFFPVSLGTPNSLSKVEYANGIAIVTTRSITSFYSVIPPPAIRAVGEVELTFVLAPSSDSRRLERKLQADSGAFEVDIRVGLGSEDGSGVERGREMYASLVSAMVLGFAVAF